MKEKFICHYNRFIDQLKIIYSNEDTIKILDDINNSTDEDKIQRGLLFNSLLINENFDLFIIKYWFKNYKINYNFLSNNFNLKYFRMVEYKNKMINEYKSYKIRSKIKNLYFSKIWILRYQNWLIVNFYCFQPLTLKKNKIRFNIGYNHSIFYYFLENIKICSKRKFLYLFSYSYFDLKKVVVDIKNFRKLNSYKLKGIKIKNELFIKKNWKKKVN